MFETATKLQSEWDCRYLLNVCTQSESPDTLTAQVVCLNESLSSHSGHDETFLVLLLDRA